MNPATSPSPIGKTLIILAVLLAAAGSVYFAMNPGKVPQPTAKPASATPGDSKPAEAKPSDAKPAEAKPDEPSNQHSDQQSEAPGANQSPAK